MSRRNQKKVLAAIIAEKVRAAAEPMPEYLNGPPKVEVVKKPAARKPAAKKTRARKKRGSRA